ncbi:hypothetical protein SS05631_c29570 [Sinorhizobium sp. CCBAU 05631]|nr:hypothetical protein SS05631_c29570 [Sinorhizobium sp. CCBAU 05631]
MAARTSGDISRECFLIITSQSIKALNLNAACVSMFLVARELAAICDLADLQT